MTDAKHEAPAEGAGEMDDDDDASTYAPSVAGLSDYLWNQAQAADSVEGRCILEMWREAVDALRARSSAPEAREVLERIREMDFKAIYGEANYQKLADDLDALYTHPAAPSADKLRKEVTRDQIMGVVRQYAAPAWCSVDRMADALVAIMSPAATPDALKGDA